MNCATNPAAPQESLFNCRSISERVEAWHCNGLPADGLSASERAEVIEDAQGAFLAEFVGKTKTELQTLEDKELVAAHYWAMNEATR